METKSFFFPLSTGLRMAATASTHHQIARNMASPAAWAPYGSPYPLVTCTTPQASPVISIPAGWSTQFYPSAALYTYPSPAMPVVALSEAPISTSMSAVISGQGAAAAVQAAAAAAVAGGAISVPNGYATPSMTVLSRKDKTPEVSAQHH